MELDLSPRRVDLLGENFDIAVRVGALPDDTLLAARRIAMFPMGLYAAPGYLAERGDPVSPDDLVHYEALRLFERNRGSGGLDIDQRPTALGREAARARYGQFSGIADWVGVRWSGDRCRSGGLAAPSVQRDPSRAAGLVAAGAPTGLGGVSRTPPDATKRGRLLICSKRRSQAGITSDPRPTLSGRPGRPQDGYAENPSRRKSRSPCCPTTLNFPADPGDLPASG